MKTYTNRPPGFLKLAATAIIGFVASVVFVQGNAFATTAANTVISNIATVSWEDSNNLNPTSTTASVDVTVNLVEATPTLSAPGDQSVDSNNSVDYTYTITSNANGVDTYNLTSSQTGTTGTITGNVTVFRDSGDTTDITSIDLGATSVAAAAAGGATAITVPADGASDASINGIEAGDTLVIGGNTYTVSSITDNATGTSTINLSAGLVAGVSVGAQIGEQAQFIFRVTPTATVDGSTVDNAVSAQDVANVQAAATDTTTTTVNYSAPNITVTKYVRNVTNAAGNSGGAGAQSINGATYYTSGVTGNPTDTLEYVIVVSNAGGAGSAANVVISDPIPAYTTYVGSSMDYDNHTAITGSGAWTSVTDAENDTDKGEFDPTAGAEEVWIYGGVGGADTGTATTYGDGTGGSVAGGSFTFGRFQVTIDN